MENVCTNPGSLTGGKSVYTTYFPRHSQFGDLPLPDGVTEPFGVYRDFFYGQCVTNQYGFNYLQVTVEPAPGDQRTNPADFEGMSNIGSIFGYEQEMGLHLLDYNLPLGNLIDLVKDQIANR
jgi:hypothetical protein